MLIVVGILALLLTLLFTIIPSLWFLATETEGARLQWMRWSRQAMFWRLNIVPYVLIWGIGAFMLVRRCKRHPKVSISAFVGLGGLALLSGIEFCLRNGWFPGASSLRGSTGPSKASDIFVTAVTWYHSVGYPWLSAACWCLIFMAILGWRNEGLRDKTDQQQLKTPLD
jgi:hypothetical protein